MRADGFPMQKSSGRSAALFRDRSRHSRGKSSATVRAGQARKNSSGNPVRSGSFVGTLIYT
jgi:hypothetical protein